MSKASFVRKVNFHNSGSGFALSSAVFYEDEKRVYAFLTFRNNSTSHVRGCTLRLLPYDSDRKPLQGFGARIDDLDLPVNREKEYASPLLLPKDAFAFNWSFYEIEYSNPDKVKDSGVAISNRASSLKGNVSDEAMAEASMIEREEEDIEREASRVVTELDETIEAIRSIPLKKIRKRRADRSLRFGLFISAILVAALAGIFAAFVAECHGDIGSFFNNFGSHIQYESTERDGEHMESHYANGIDAPLYDEVRGEGR